MSDPLVEPEPTAETLMRFLDGNIKRGDLKAPTGNAMKTAVKEVLESTEGEDWQKVDVARLDLDDVTRRFETLRSMDYSPNSLGTYKGRFVRSVTMFRQFRANPSGWRPDLKQRSSRSTTKANAITKGADSSEPTIPEPSPFASQSISKATMIKYPFPLRDGVLAALDLPADLTKRESKRLCGFIDSLGIDEQGQLNAGPPALPVGNDS